MTEAEELELLELEQEESKSKAAPEISKLESGIRGAGQGLTFGFSDEAMAALRRMAGGDYDELLKEERLKNELAKQANPLTYKGSELGGGIATSFIPGIGLAKGASVAKNIGMAALQGATSGAGYAEGDLEDRAKSALVGGGVSGALGAAGSYAAKQAPKIGKSLFSRPFSQLDELASQKEKIPVSSLFWEEGLTPKSNKQIVKQTAGLLDKYGKQKKAIDSVIKETGLIGNIDEALSRAQSYVDKLKSTRPTQEVGDLLQSDLDSLYTKYRNGSPISFSELGGEKAGVSKMLKPEEIGVLQRSGIVGGFKKAKGLGLLEQQAQLAEAAQPGLGQTLQELGQKESSLITAAKRMKGSAVTEAGRLPFTQVSAMGAVIDPKIAIANELARLGKFPAAATYGGRAMASPFLQEILLRSPVSTYRGLIQGE